MRGWVGAEVPLRACLCLCLHQVTCLRCPACNALTCTAWPAMPDLPWPASTPPGLVGVRRRLPQRLVDRTHRSLLDGCARVELEGVAEGLRACGGHVALTATHDPTHVPTAHRCVLFCHACLSTTSGLAHTAALAHTQHTYTHPCVGRAFVSCFNTHVPACRRREPAHLPGGAALRGASGAAAHTRLGGSGSSRCSTDSGGGRGGGQQQQQQQLRQQ